MICLFSLSVRLIMSCKLVLVIFVYVLLQLPQGSSPSPTGSQAPITVTAVEGISTNLYIVCGLDGEVTPLYWNVNGSVFDLYSVPTIFRTDRYDGLVIPAIDRELNNLTFQCFTINEKGLRHSRVTLLIVIRYDGSVRPANFNYQLDPPRQGRVLLDYQNLDTAMLRWHYHHSATCIATKYRVDMYNDSAVTSAESEGQQLEPFHHFYSFTENTTLPHDPIYIAVSALDTNNISCARTDYLTGILGNRSETHEYNPVYTSSNSASFDIPQGSDSLQLIWSKDINTQCVCPPVEEIISECACNKNNTSNLITISGGRLTISNLAEEDHVMLYFTSASSGCGNQCNIRSIRSSYKIQYHGHATVETVVTDQTVTTDIGYPTVSSKAGSNLLTCYNVMLMTVTAVLLTCGADNYA